MHRSALLDFDTLVERYRQPLTRAAYHLCGNREAAFDIVQDTLLDAYKGIESIREPEKAGAWLFAILRRKALTYNHLHGAELELLEEPVIPGPGDADSIVREIFVERMSKLPEEDREILAGKYMLGLSYQELAESLGIKEGTVRVRCLRAKEKLRSLLSGVGVEAPGRRG